MTRLQAGIVESSSRAAAAAVQPILSFKQVDNKRKHQFYHHGISLKLVFDDCSMKDETLPVCSVVVKQFDYPNSPRH